MLIPIVMAAVFLVPALLVGGAVAGAAGSATVTGTVTDLNGAPFASPIHTSVLACPTGTLTANGCGSQGLMVGANSSGNYLLNLSPPSFPASYDIVGLASVGAGFSHSNPITVPVSSSGQVIPNVNFNVPAPPVPPPSNTSSLSGMTVFAGTGLAANTTFRFTNVSCHPTGVSSFSYTADGTTGSNNPNNPNAPFPGTFHETGTVTMQGASGSLLSASAQFSMTDTSQNPPVTTVTGNATFDPTNKYAGTLPNACAPSGTPTAGAINLTAPVTYTAQTPNGSDSGTSIISLSNTCPGLVSNPAAGQCPTPSGSLAEVFGPAPGGHATYTGPTWGDLGDTAVFSVRLTDQNYNPLVGAQVVFGVPYVLCSATTDSTGVATCTSPPLTGLGHAGPWLFGIGGSAETPGPVPFLITPEETVLTYTGPTVVAAGATVALSGKLFSDDGVPIVGASITLSLGSQSCPATTDATGTGTCSVTAAAGAVTATAAFAGNGDYQASNPSTTPVVVAAYPSGGGNFVIGNQNATVGNDVTFWGAQWSAQNSLSGGSAPSSFKGFVNNPASGASCGTQWSTSPGNSSNPPATVPGYMAVIVTSSVTKAGSAISGNATAIVVLKTDPGYSGNPGHAGTGTVVAVFPCS